MIRKSENLCFKFIPENPIELTFLDLVQKMTVPRQSLDLVRISEDLVVVSSQDTTDMFNFLIKLNDSTSIPIFGTAFIIKSNSHGIFFDLSSEEIEQILNKFSTRSELDLSFDDNFYVQVLRQQGNEDAFHV